MFWSTEFWPPNRPDLNPLDYYVRSVDERVANTTRNPNVATLCTAIEASFTNMDGALSNSAYERFRPSTEAVTAADGGYIE